MKFTLFALRGLLAGALVMVTMVWFFGIYLQENPFGDAVFAFNLSPQTEIVGREQTKEQIADGQLALFLEAYDNIPSDQLTSASVKSYITTRLISTTYHYIPMPRLGYSSLNTIDRSSSSVLGAQAMKCDGWANAGEKHCNTGTCQQFTCGADSNWQGPQGSGVCALHPDCQGRTTPVAPTQVKCDGWANPGESHCNTGSCQQFTCGSNGLWQGPQGTGLCAGHPECQTQVQCGGFANPGEAHCNTGSCQQYTCLSGGQWSAAQGAGVCGGHPDCQQVSIPTQPTASNLCDGWARPGTSYCDQTLCNELTCSGSGSWSTTATGGQGVCQLFSCSKRNEPRCGDNVCNGYENCTSCAADCAQTAQCQRQAATCTGGLKLTERTCDQTTCTQMVCSAGGILLPTSTACESGNSCLTVPEPEEPDPGRLPPDIEATQPDPNATDVNGILNYNLDCSQVDCMATYAARTNATFPYVQTQLDRVVGSGDLMIFAAFKAESGGFRKLDSTDKLDFMLQEYKLGYGNDILNNTDFQLSLVSLMYNLMPDSVRSNVTNYAIGYAPNAMALVSKSMVQCNKSFIMINPITMYAYYNNWMNTAKGRDVDVTYVNATSGFDGVKLALVHEAAHILNFRPTEMIDATCLTQSPEELQQARDIINNCSTERLFGLGVCILDSSPNLNFYRTFWQSYIAAGHPGQLNASDGAQLQSWYNKRPQEFVSHYATTSFVEDWAETFTAAVIDPKVFPYETTSVARKKIEFIQQDAVYRNAIDYMESRL